MIAAEVGHLDLAHDYLTETALMDLRDLEHNTRDGLHLASLAGAWIAAVAGFGGMRDYFGELTFAPRLPPELTRLVFRMCFSSSRLSVEVCPVAGTSKPAARSRHRPANFSEVPRHARAAAISSQSGDRAHARRPRALA